MRNTLLIICLVAGLLGIASCQGKDPVTGLQCDGRAANSPSDAYRQLYSCVKAKDKAGISRIMSKATNAFVETVAGMQKQDVGKVYENGLTATTFAARLPEIRDERISDEFGKVEVWNEKDKRWEDLPFIKEDGSWKLAIGDDWTGSFKSPGKGRAQLEAEAANVSSNNMIPVSPNINANSAAKIFKPTQIKPPADFPATNQAESGAKK